MIATTLKLKGMSCAACANSVEMAISQVPGVSNVQVNFTAGSEASPTRGAEGGWGFVRGLA